MMKEKLLNRYWALPRALRTVLSLLPGAFAFLSAAYFILFPSEGYYHSDCTDYLFWAEMTADTGKLLDPTYNYAGFLPFGAPLWLVPLIRLFGVNMAVHKAGMLIFLLLFAAAALFFMRSLKWSISRCSWGLFILLGVISSSEKLREIFHMHVLYYSLGLLLLFVLLGIFIRAREQSFKKSLLWCVPVFLLCFGTATDGFQLLLLAALPAFAALVLERLLSEERLLSGRTLSLFLLLAVGTVGAFCGTVFLSSVIGEETIGYAAGYSEWSKPSAWIGNLLLFPEKYFTLLGVSIEENQPLASLDSFFDFLSIGAGVLLLILPFLYLRRLRTLSPKRQILVLSHVMLTAALLVCFVFGKISNLNWRLSPILGTSALVSFDYLVLLFREARENKSAPDGNATERVHTGGDKFAVRFTSLLLAFLFVFAALPIFHMASMPHDYGQDNDLHVLAREIDRLELDHGYATFWTAQALSVLCGEAPRVVNVVINQSRGCAKGGYQSADRWYESVPGADRYFIIANEGDYGEYTALMASNMWKKELKGRCLETHKLLEGRYYILVFGENIF